MLPSLRHYPSADDFAKEPPLVPPQIALTLLNMPAVPDAPNLLPRPQHVVLNHMYHDKSKMVKGVHVLGKAVQVDIRLTPR